MADTSGLRTIPDRWVWVTLGALIQRGPQNGLYLPGALSPCGCRMDQIGRHCHPRIHRAQVVTVDVSRHHQAVFARFRRNHDLRQSDTRKNICRMPNRL